MAIFGNLELENLVQENDKTRLDATKSFIVNETSLITLVRIDPGDGAGFIDVYSGAGATATNIRNFYIDWQYSSDNGGTPYTVQLEITTDGAPSVTTKDILVISEADDALFSTDAELTPHEPQILNWVAPGRATFKNVHRLAQDAIITHFDEIGLTDTAGNRLTKAAVTDIQEVNDWSKYLTLKFIFEAQSNDVGDVFDEKAQKYSALAEKRMNRAIIRLDRDGDGNEDPQKYYLASKRLKRR